MPISPEAQRGYIANVRQSTRPCSSKMSNNGTTRPTLT